MVTKRISAELSGDSAIRAEVIYTTTRLSEEPKKEADRMFCELSMYSLEKVIELCKNETGVQYPSHAQLLAFLNNEAYGETK